MRAPIALATILFATPAASPARDRFSFRSIEFAPADVRLPTARSWLARHAAPGMPVDGAIAAARRAEAACRTRPDAEGAIVCRYARFASDSALDLPAGDVTWTVRIVPAADGRVASATVRRDRAGF